MEWYIYLIIGIIILLILVLKFQGGESTWKSEVRIKASEISKTLASNDPMVLSTLLIHADKLLDHSLKSYGIKGETMGERLKNARRTFDKNLYNRIWEAHKLRNRIAHEQNVEIRTREIKQHIETLLTAIKQLLG